MSLIKSVGAGEQSTGFYKHLLDQSLKFNKGDAPRLTRSIGTPTNETVWTFSCWLKRSTLNSVANADHPIVSGGTNASNYEVVAFWNSTDDVIINSTSTGSRNTATSAVFRDLSSWYHLVVQRNDANQVIYINGVAVSTISNASTSVSYLNKSGHTMTIGGHVPSLSTVCFDGYLAEVVFVDGTAVPIGSLGETKDGIWVAKDPSGLTFGNNGFHLTFKDDVVSEGFNTVTYRGTGANQSISGLGFEPAFVWLKSRSATYLHYRFDSVRGPTKRFTNTSGAESTTSTELISFDADGFTVGSDAGTNQSGGSMVAWCWEAGGTPTADNSAGAGATPTAGSVKIDGSNLGSALAGSIPATRLSANTTKGFSVVTYTGTGSAGTIAHGLGAAPKWVIVKCRSNAISSPAWPVWHTSIAGTEYLDLQTSAAKATAASVWNSTVPTSSVFSVGTTSSCNTNNYTYVAYCWTDISGYSKFGTWQNNNSTTGTQVTGLGFKPAWMMVKDIDAGETWYILDNTRQPTNVSPPSTKFLIPNATSTEGSNNASTATIDFQDDGFQIKTTNPASGEISYGTRNYIYMAFADTREAAFFKDVTTNGNHFTPVNLDYRDSVPDTPTNNFCTMNSIAKKSTVTLSEGNLKSFSNDTSIVANVEATFGISSGKWYFEASGRSGSNVGYPVIYLADASTRSFNNTNYTGNGCSAYGAPIVNGSLLTRVASLSLGSTDVRQFAFDFDDGKMWIGKNGTWYNNSGTSFTNSTGPESGNNFNSNAGFTYDVGKLFSGHNDGSCAITFNFGQDSSFAGIHATANANADGNGHGSFAYAPPSGFLALCSQNLPNVAIIDGTEHFNTVLYTGNAGTQSITGVGFSPDWLWVKNRQTAYNHALVDSVRGATLSLSSNTTDAERTPDITSLDSDGFSLQFVTATGSFSENQGSQSYVSWNWLAGTAFSGTTNRSKAYSGQSNNTAGFSIITYVGDEQVGHEIPHNLDAAPEFVLAKSRGHADHWDVYHKGIAADAETDYIRLNSTNAAGDAASVWNDTAPSSTVVSLGNTDDVNKNNIAHIMYCFHSVEGYSKVGSYIGNGSADGTFVYTGFRPAWVLIRSSGVGHWIIFDSTRHPSNVNDLRIYANQSNAEDSSYSLDLLSNGFKPRHTGSDFNSSGVNYIYLAFAESPFKFANAR